MFYWFIGLSMKGWGLKLEDLRVRVSMMLLCSVNVIKEYIRTRFELSSAPLHMKYESNSSSNPNCIIHF